MYDPCVEIFFDTNGRATWIVPSNIGGLAEKGSCSRHDYPSGELVLCLKMIIAVLLVIGAIVLSCAPRGWWKAATIHLALLLLVVAHVVVWFPVPG
jgi:hypothetical protein